MKQLIKFLNRTSRDVLSNVKKRLTKAKHSGQLSISLSVGIPPFVSVRFGYILNLKADNENAQKAQAN
ncbi:trans-acting factor B [uncultured Roseibium sp.]|uniref:trans-acting factor B n=1 Tax=uncultured Roseibium sp. TaxID=1936171 RepID=UPI002631B9C1|nr:trans-acting factor B [uncultured Roseibium sp.]MCR9059444.1 hypothetical protein [Paracoccaceae bacterium]